MLAYALRRTLAAIPLILGITIVIYGILIAAPGGPEQKFAANPRFTQAQREAFIRAWGLDQPIPVQYCRWLGACDPDGEGLGAFIGPKGLPAFLPTELSGTSNGLLHGDLGFSISSGEPVGRRIAQAALPTFILASSALLVWLAIALVIGLRSALREGRRFDHVAGVVSYVTYSIPTFWLAILLISIFAVGLGLFPVSGMTDTRTSPPFGSDAYWTRFAADPLGSIAGILHHLALPVATLAIVSFAGDARIVRGAAIESLRGEYVRTARAKGLAERRVLLRHVLRNSLIPFVTNLGLALPFLFTGAVITETMFAWPGVGLLTIQATSTLDYPILMGVLLFGGILVVVGNLLADILSALVDPRVRL